MEYRSRSVSLHVTTRVIFMLAKAIYLFQDVLIYVCQQFARLNLLSKKNIGARGHTGSQQWSMQFPKLASLLW